MAKLTHTHYLSKEDPESAHLDSRGQTFGADEHQKLVEEHDWPEDTKLDPVEHVHTNIDELRDSQDVVIGWVYRPPTQQEEEVRPRVAAAARSSSQREDVVA